MFSARVKGITCLALVMQASVLMAIENFPDSHQHEHHTVIDTRTTDINSDIFACDIIGYSNQCREYEILDSAKTTLSEIKSGCESMNGQFSQQSCPEDKVLALCTDIIRNYHQPDVIYSNHYYQSDASIWTIALVQEVCGDLGGEFLLPKAR